jgi:hypothetical protein
MTDTIRHTGTTYAYPTRAEALAAQARHGGTIDVARYGRRVWTVHVPRTPGR